MGGFLGIGHSSAKTDRGNQLAGQQNLSNVFNYALPTGTAQESQGSQDLSTSSNYWKSILSGNRANVTQAVAPETNAVRSASDASARQQAAEGTARGGGTNATNQQRQTTAQSKVDDAIFAARPKAAEEEQKVAGTELSNAQNLLGLGTQAEEFNTQLSETSRGQSYAINQDTIGKVTSAIDAVLTGVFA